MKNRRCHLLSLLFPIAIAGSFAAIRVEAREASLVLSPAPSRVEKFAASELGKYLEAATGTKANIAGQDSPRQPDDLVFYIGNLEANNDDLSQAGFPLEKLAGTQMIEEGIFASSDGKQTLLVGKGERGALNAVYSYLEEAIGCHWPEPGREFVPKLADWSPTPLQLVVNPQLAWRGWANHGRLSREFALELMDWQAKNRMNSLQIFPAPYQEYKEGGESFLNAILDRGLLPNVGGHSRDYFLNGPTYLAQHPEWFASEHGKKTEQLDYENFDSLPTYIANVVAYLKKHPEIKIVSLWPNDGYGFNPMTSKERNATDILLAYVNKLAAGINAEVPAVKCEFLAYIIYTAAPLSTKPLPSIIPTYCEHYSSFGARDHWRAITEDIGSNKQLRDELVKWIATSSQVTQFSYYGDDCIKHYLFNPLPEVMVADCRYYSSVGLAGNFFLFTNPMSWWINAETAYAYARASWDKNATAEKISSDYYGSLYGPAAKPMQDFTRAIQELYKIAPAKATADYVGAIDLAGSGKSYEDLLKQYAEGIARAESALGAAEAAMPNPDDWFKERIRKLRSDTRYIDLWFQVECGLQQQQSAKSTKLKEQLFALIDEGLKLEIVADDDAKGYGSANAIFNRRRVAIEAIPCTAP